MIGYDADVNYFAHGMRFLDRPHFLAGTAVPDWLSVVDRAVRVRPRLTEPLATGDGSRGSEIAAGILQHFHDDGWFHTTRGFAVVTGELTRRFQSVLPGDQGLRPGFLGHIATEMLLDAVLIDRDPRKLDAYYETLRCVDARDVQEIVNRSSRRTTEHLVGWIELFLSEAFLRDYADSRRLLTRLNQVLRRVKLQPLPSSAIDVLDEGRNLVAEHVGALLPPAHFA